MHERTDDGRKVIIIAHPEHSSGELQNVYLDNYASYLELCHSQVQYCLLP